MSFILIFLKQVKTQDDNESIYVIRIDPIAIEFMQKQKGPEIRGLFVLTREIIIFQSFSFQLLLHGFLVLKL